VAAVFGPLLAESMTALAIFGIMGFVLYENSLGFYFAARSRHPMQEALRRVLRLPSIYAFLLGLALNVAGVEIAGAWRDLAQSYRGAYTVFGMMFVGVGLGQAKIAHWDLRFTGFALLSKFLVWPLMVGAAIALDRAVFGVFPLEVHRIAFLLSIVPLPANGIAVATELDVEPERIAVATIVSTAVALLVIPAYLAIAGI
jgi:predicted permease